MTTETNVTEGNETATENEPVYVQFVKRIVARAIELNVQLEDKKGWQEFSGPNGHRIVIQKSQTKLPVIETTLDPEVCGGTAVPKPNGRIKARLAADPAAVMAALECLVDASNPIAPPKRGKGSAGKEIPSLDDLLAK